MATRVLGYDPSRAKALREFLTQKGFRFEEREHASFLARRGNEAAVTAYLSGKILATGPAAPAVASEIEAAGLAKALPPKPRTNAKRPIHDQLDVFPRVGLDESGKGDYFGPLVCAAVHVPDRAAESALVQFGVRDSKRMPDEVVLKVAREIEARYLVSRIIVSPTRYNDLYQEVGNLNELLAACHMRAVEDLVQRVGDRGLGLVVLDKFEAQGLVRGRLNRRFPDAEFVEVPRAEEDVAVAAASVVARAAFLTGIEALEARFGMPLAKGAGTPTQRSISAFVERHGHDRLPEVAKVHFRMTPMRRD